MPYKYREANCQSCWAEAPVAPLICYSEDADDQLEGQKNLYRCGHTQADTWLQLGGKGEFVNSQPESWNNVFHFYY